MYSQKAMRDGHEEAIVFYKLHSLNRKTCIKIDTVQNRLGVMKEWFSEILKSYLWRSLDVIPFV